MKYYFNDVTSSVFQSSKLTTNILIISIVTLTETVALETSEKDLISDLQKRTATKKKI